MNLWQNKAAKDMKDLINSLMKIKSIEITGSMLNQDLLDVFSDIDMNIYLSDNTAVDIEYFFKQIEKQFGFIFGYQILNNDNKETLRICLDNGWRFDLTFIYPKKKTLRYDENLFVDKIKNVINEFWFISVLAMVKLGRRDNLVAAHLVLELCQLNIVIQMILRDNKKGSNIHRFGDKEDVPILKSLIELKENSIENEILSILYQAAEHMENLSTPFINKTDKKAKLHEMQYLFIT